jgi:hypothetical protein
MAVGRKTAVILAVLAAAAVGVLPVQGARGASGSGAIWQIVPGPDPGLHPTLVAAGASSASDAWAVGSYTDSTDSASLSLAEHWDGSAWTVASTPSPFGNGNFLNAVADISPTDAWAVGYSTFDTGGYYQQPVYQPLIEHWDGTGWSVVPAALPSIGVPLFYGVAAVSATDVWAVGYISGEYAGVIEHWDGSSWSIVPSPASTQILWSVTAISSSDVWAAGEALKGQPAFDHWDGKTWTAFSGPPVSAGYLHMTGIAAASASDVWAVGTMTGTASGSPYQTLSEHWDGTAWSIVRSPDPVSKGNNAFFQVAAVSGNDVWAVGYGYGPTEGGGAAPILANWDGKKWQLASAPVPAGTQTDELFAVTALPTGTAWAVGRSDNQSLIITTSNG